MASLLPGASPDEPLSVTLAASESKGLLTIPCLEVIAAIRSELLMCNVSIWEAIGTCGLEGGQECLRVPLAWSILPGYG